MNERPYVTFISEADVTADSLEDLTGSIDGT